MRKDPDGGLCPGFAGRRRLLLAALATAAGASVAQDLVMEVIPLRYRTVEDVLPLLRPLVPQPGTVGGMQGNLVVRTTPANMADIRRVLDAVDREPRRLLITVRQDADLGREGSGAEVSGSIGSGDARATLPGGRGGGGLTVQGGSGDDRMRARVYGTESLENDRTAQRIQVLEGNEAYIRVGRSVPVPVRSVQRRMVDGRVVERVVDTVEYRDALTGFRVRPRVSGDTVTLTIAPQRDTPGSQGAGSIDVQRVATTVSGRLGEWIELGGIVTGGTFEESGTAWRTRRAESGARRVLVKVEPLP